MAADDLDRAKSDLAKRLEERRARRAEMGIEERDRDEATERAAARGDYKPGPGGGGTYSPFTPTRGE